jgi:hypothetical protein
MKTKLYILLLTTMVGFSIHLFSQVTAVGHISVTIVSPISITKVQDMDFGNVSVESGAGAVTLSTTSKSRKASGKAVLMDRGKVSLAAFHVKGNSGSSFSITLPNTAVTVSNGTRSMIVTNFTSTPSTSTTLTESTKEILVGATLQLTGDQSLGLYTSASDFPVTVNYN